MKLSIPALAIRLPLRPSPIFSQARIIALSEPANLSISLLSLLKPITLVLPILPADDPGRVGCLKLSFCLRNTPLLLKSIGSSSPAPRPPLPKKFAILVPPPSREYF